MKRFLWLPLLLPALAFGQTPFNPVAQTVAITAPSGSSSSSTALPGAFAASTLQVYNATSVPITWAYSRVPGGAAASSTSTIVPAGVTEYFYIGTGVFDVAVYGIGGTGTVYLQAGTGGYFQGVGVATIGSVTTGDCAKFVSNVLIQDAGACGGGGSSAFNALTSGTNTTAAMLVGTGASLGPTGSGTLNANQLNGASVPASANCLSSNVSSQLTANCPEPVNAQTGTTYTIATSDCGKQVTFSNASAIAVTVPQATGSFATCQFDVTNLGAGTATLTPTTSTINGSASLAIAQNRQCTVNSDGTNWQVIGCTALVTSSGGGSTFLYLTTNATVTGTTAATVLSFSAAANTQYVAECYTSTSANAGTVYLQFNGPSSPTTMYYAMATGASSIKTSYGSVVGVYSAATQEENNQIIFTLVNGANAGTVSLQMSNNTAGDTSTMYAGSYCRLN